MFTESVAQRDRSSSPREPSSSSTWRWSFAHTRAVDHSEQRRWAVAPDGPNVADGNCCHVQPDVATDTIAADTSVTVSAPATALRPDRSLRHHSLEQVPAPAGG